MSLSGSEVIDDTRRIVEGSGADRFTRIDLDSTIGVATLETVPYQFSGSERAISGDDVEGSVFATTIVGTDREEGKRIVHVSCLRNFESAGRVGRSLLLILPTAGKRNTCRRTRRDLVLILYTCPSVVFHEDTASGAEIVPVVLGDDGVRVDGTHRTSGLLVDVLLDTRLGVDEDEAENAVVVADADFEVGSSDRVVVDDVVHVRVPLGPVSRPTLGHVYYTILRQECNPLKEYSQNWG